MLLRVLLGISTLTLLASGGSAQPAATPPSPPNPPIDSVTGLATTGHPEPEGAGPVEVPPPTEKALRFYRSGNVLWALDVVLGFLIPALFLFTGFSARLRDLARRIGRNWFFTIVLYFVFFTLVNFLIGLPLAYYVEFVRQHAYGLSNQTLGKWMGDTAKGLAIGLAMGGLFLWVPYLLLKKSPRRWWLYTSLLSVPFICLLLLVTPVWLDPLFNDFGEMKDKTLEGQILALAERAGIEGSRVYEVNKSVDTKAVNAYVTGFGETKRIVLWDTIIAKLTPRELLVVMGHEMGHYVLGHVYKGIAFFSLFILVNLYLAHRAAAFFIGRHGPRMGFSSLADVASLPLLILVSNLFSFVATPVALAYTRYQEHESDRFGLEITRDNRAAAMAFVKLQAENLGVPRPDLLYKLWRSSHPPIGERIDFCNDYRPWERGEPLRYQHLFTSGRPGAPGQSPPR